MHDDFAGREEHETEQQEAGQAKEVGDSHWPGHNTRHLGPFL